MRLTHARQIGSSLQPAGPRTILVVDDHQPSLRALARLLNRFGFYAREATTLAEARRLGTEEPPDVLVSDLQLPDGDGCDLARSLLSIKPDLVAIALSGFDSDSDKDRCRIAGFRSFFAKPLDFQDLLEVLESSAARDVDARSRGFVTRLRD